YIRDSYSIVINSSPSLLREASTPCRMPVVSVIQVPSLSRVINLRSSTIRASNNGGKRCGWRQDEYLACTVSLPMIDDQRCYAFKTSKRESATPKWTLIVPAGRGTHVRDRYSLH